MDRLIKQPLWPSSRGEQREMVRCVGESSGVAPPETPPIAEGYRLYYVFLNYDPEYERLRAGRRDTLELDYYLTKKHNELLVKILGSGTFRKRISLAIFDAFPVEITDEQAEILRLAKEVRYVETNMEIE